MLPGSTLSCWRLFPLHHFHWWNQPACCTYQLREISQWAVQGVRSITVSYAINVLIFDKLCSRWEDMLNRQRQNNRLVFTNQCVSGSVWGLPLRDRISYLSSTRFVEYLQKIPHIWSSLGYLLISSLSLLYGGGKTTVCQVPGKNKLPQAQEKPLESLSSVHRSNIHGGSLGPLAGLWPSAGLLPMCWLSVCPHSGSGKDLQNPEDYPGHIIYD